MSITRTPRPAIPDTRRAIADGTMGRNTWPPSALGRGRGMTNGHVLELRARARRANLVVTERETPPRPAPTTVLWDTYWTRAARRCGEVIQYQGSGKVIVLIGGFLCARRRHEIQVVTRW